MATQTVLLRTSIIKHLPQQDLMHIPSGLRWGKKSSFTHVHVLQMIQSSYFNSIMYDALMISLISNTIYAGLLVKCYRLGYFREWHERSNPFANLPLGWLHVYFLQKCYEVNLFLSAVYSLKACAFCIKNSSFAHRLLRMQSKIYFKNDRSSYNNWISICPTTRTV